MTVKRLMGYTSWTSAVLVCAAAASAADWPMARCDARRTGYTNESLPANLTPAWTYRAARAPMPAWPKESRLDFDHAFHPVVAGGKVVFGSSVDGCVYAIDAKTGKPCWSFLTKAPVRFAPAVWKDRLFVGSDDGYLYCLSLAKGELLWKQRGGADDRMVLGNGRMVSRWPVRGGPVVAGDVVYFGAGIWPTDGIYLYALDAKTGKTIWCNDQAGFLYWKQPHGGANAKSGVSSHGYFAVAGDKLIVPTGRAVPAVFDRKTGKLSYFHLQKFRADGGVHVVAFDDVLINGADAFRLSDGEKVGEGVSARTTAAGVGVIVTALAKTKRAMVDNKTTTKLVTELVGVDGSNPFDARKARKETWKTTIDAAPGGVIVAGKSAVCGYDGGVCLVDMATGRQQWSAKVDGEARSLAVAKGRLYVSTDRGVIACFSADRQAKVNVITAGAKAESKPGDQAIVKAVDKIMKVSGVTEGYCLDLGCGDGALACELARRTKLMIYAVDPDADNVQRARDRARRAGLLGHRVTVHQAELGKTHYPPYFADLVVSQRALTGATDEAATTEANRVARPCGGVICVGKPGDMAKRVRGPVEGGGQWTHQYCNPANTGCSRDTVAKGPLGILWFDRPPIGTPNRHGRGFAPLYMNGRFFTAGVDKVCGLNAYNGRLLWEFTVPTFQKAFHQEHLMGVAGTNSSFCAADGSVYVGYLGACYRLDAATGEKLGEFPTPDQPDGRPGRWGWIACQDGILFGTVVNREHIVPYRYLNSDMRTQFTEALMLFAMDAKTGKLLWKRVAEASFRHNAIAVGDGRVHVIDRPLAFERPKKSKAPARPHKPGTLLALDAKSGKVLWQSNDDVWGTVLELSTDHDALVMCYQPTRFKLESEKGGKFRAYRASTGKQLWECEAGYKSRPLLNDKLIIAEPGAWNLLTGKPKMTEGKDGEPVPWRFSRSYGCGITSGSRNLLLFRSATMGYVDLTVGHETQNFGGIRPGCWINTLPVGGIVLMPDSTNVCTCSYLNKASVALTPMEPSWPPAERQGAQKTARAGR